MSKILVKSNGFGGVSYMIDPRQRGGPTFMDLGRRVLDTNLGGGQRLGALAGLAGKIGAGAVAANQAAYGLQAGNISAPFGAMDQYAALDPTRGMKLTDAENERRMREQAAEQVTQERMKTEAQRQAEIAAQPQAQTVTSIPLPPEQPQQPTIPQGFQGAVQGTLSPNVPPIQIPTQQAQVQDPTQVQDPNYVPPQTQPLITSFGNQLQPTTHHNVTPDHSSVNPHKEKDAKNLTEAFGNQINPNQNSNQLNRSYVDMAFNEMGDIFHKQTAEDVANAITFTFLKHRR